MRGFISVLTALVLLFTNCTKEPAPITGVKLKLNELTLNVDSTFTFIPVFEPEEAYDRVEWSSTNPFVASIDENGVVTAHQTGVTIVKAKVKELTAECMVTVVPHIYTAGRNAVMDGDKELYKVNEKTILRADADHNIYTTSTIPGESYTHTIQIKKNGQPLYKLYKGDLNSGVTAFEIDGTNLYTAIDIYDNYTAKQESRVYKNGQLYHHFDDYTSTSIRSVCANGNDVYCGGYIYNGRFTAAVWKNKQLLYSLYNTLNDAWVKSIAIDGDDVYSLVSVYHRHIYLFKNDQQIFYTNEYGESSNLVVKDGHVYLVLGENQYAYIYVDGQKGVPLKTEKYQGTLSMTIYETAICGEDLYTVGICNYNPIIWKNGEILYRLPNSIEDLTSISVQP